MKASADAAVGGSNGDAYDLLPYDSRPYPDTQPGQLAALAVLHGLLPAEVTRGRVLELGCASGGNIVPLAARFPKASFIGIDLSARHIAEGQERIRTLGLANIELRQGDLATCDSPGGPFDTIICHGVYSWVSPAVQEAILRIMARHLAPAGLAYISYNTLPGWHLRQIVRDVFQYHAGTSATPQQKISKGLDLLGELARVTDAMRPYGQALRAEAKLLAQTPPSYIMGEYFAAANTPCYFHEFAARASSHGLAYVSETRLGLGPPEDLDPELGATIRVHAGDDPIAFEQYVDLFVGRQFRASVLVRADRGARISRTIAPARLDGLHLATSLELDLDASSSGRIAFRNSDGRIFAVNDPDVSRAFELLAAIAPRTLTPKAVCTEAVPASVDDRAARESRVVEALLGMITAGFGTASTDPIRAGEADTSRPRAWLIARNDAIAHRPWTTNLGHRVVELDELTRWVLPRLDGGTDRTDLARQLVAAVGSGEVARSGFETKGLSLSMAEATDTINRVIELCARSALLEPSDA